MFLRKENIHGKEIEAVSRSMAIIRFKPDGTILDANANFLGVVGYSVDEIRGRHHSIFVPSEERQSHEYKDFWAELARGIFHAREFRRIAKNGNEIWIQASYNPVLDDKGHVSYVVKYASDITAQKLKNADYEGQLSAIGKAQAVIQFNLDGTIIDANENFLATLGYDRSEIVGKHHSMFADPRYAQSAEYKAFWQQLGRGEYASGEFQRFGKGGKEIWIQASYNPIFDMNGKPFKVVKYATDITAQKLKNADYAGQIAAIGKSQAVIEFNLDGTVVTANENFLGALGYALSEIQGRHHSMFVDPAEAAQHEYRQFWDNLRAGKFDSRVYRRIKKNGGDIWIQASYNPIFDMNGKPLKIVKYATDVTSVIQVGAVAEETSSNTQSVAAAVEEMSASIDEISKNMALTSQSTAHIAGATAQAGAAAEQLIGNAQAMESIIHVIEEIAGQTNLLALNATIEAARAGEFGKGFAVVANEVKVLAAQTAKATDDVTREIKNVQLASQALRQNIGDVAQSVGTVDNYVSSVAGAIEEQSAVTKEISGNANKIAQLVEDITVRIKRLC